MTEPLTDRAVLMPAEDLEQIDLITERARLEALARVRGRRSTAMTRTPQERAAIARLALQDTPLTVGRAVPTSRGRRPDR